ncbi:MAG: hypothetical protein K5639_06055 [Eubacterium sp.]|nr:hypothetical protein [Eubacterium sp.]
MSGIDKDKAMNFFDKAVDKVNEGTEKAVEYAKEHELDQRAKEFGESLKEGFQDFGSTMKETFGNKD